MTAGLALDAGLALLVLAVAIWTLVAAETFAAVVGFVAFGLLMALAWVRLDAADVALTEAAIGGGLTGVLLLLAARRIGKAPAADPPGAAMRLAAALLCVVIAAALGAAVLLLPDPAPSLVRPAAERLPALGIGNAVTGVLLGYRALDTMLEKVVVLLALLGVWSLAPDRRWGGRPGPHRIADPDSPLTFLARLLPPIGIVVGVYMVWVATDAPGGAFQGGAILAAMWLLTLMAGLGDAPRIGSTGLRFLLVVGVLAFLAVGMAGVWWADGFLAYPPAFARPLIVGVEAALTLSTAVTLALLVVGPPERATPR
jgi:multisubunit Na+/H+ antiporter MnhB subunit